MTMAALELPLNPLKPEEYTQKLARVALDELFLLAFVLSAEGIVLDCSRPAMERAGLTGDDVIGRPLRETFWWAGTPKKQAELGAAIQRAAGGELVRYQVEVLASANGETMVLDFTLRPIRDDDGCVGLLSAEGRLIGGEDARTARLAELARLRGAQFETLFNRIPLGVYIVDSDFRICEVNPVALPVFGNIPGGVFGRDFEEIIRILWEKEYADEVVAIFRHTLETGESHITPERGECRADTKVTEHYEWRVDRMLLPDNRFGVVCYFQDISDRKRAEQNANLLASIVESSEDAIVSKNLEGIIMSWNQGAERLFGYTAAEVVGRSIAIVIPHDRQDEEPRILDRLRRGERVEHFETVRVRKDGRYVNVSLTISPVRAPNGRIVGASKVARDITEKVRQEQIIQEANAALTRANDDLQQFAYSASHDLQEPLRMVAIYSELLRKHFGGQLGPTGEEYISHTIQGAKRMESLLRDLRVYTQVSMVGEDPTDEIDAEEALKKTLLNLEVAINDSGASITSGPLPTVRIYRFQLEQVFQNLIGNAIRYRGSEPSRIHISAVRDGDRWLFSARDNGIGIEPQFQGQIFGIFKRLHSADEYSGTGMGLAICQRAIERAGGKIWVESEPGVGSTFYFAIPA
jgi:PAS domain S-box-containing protein